VGLELAASWHRSGLEMIRWPVTRAEIIAASTEELKHWWAVLPQAHTALQRTVITWLDMELQERGIGKV